MEAEGYSFKNKEKYKPGQLSSTIKLRKQNKNGGAKLKCSHKFILPLFVCFSQLLVCSLVSRSPRGFVLAAAAVARDATVVARSQRCVTAHAGR